MPLNDLFDFDPTTPANNIDVASANVAEGCLPSGINNAIRNALSIVLRAVGYQGANIASAATTNIAAANTGIYAHVTGTTTITSFGTVRAGTFRIIEFDGILTLTHNATSLKLPGSANITTAAGDIGFFISLGSGNWKCLHYSKADGSAVAGGFSGTLTSTDAGATEAPDFIADRNSASPAASDIIGGFVLRGRDSGANATDYARLKGKILDPTNGSEDGAAIIAALVAGADTDILTIGPGVQVGAPTGADKGAGTLNASGLYVAGHGTIAQVVRDTEATYTTLGTILPFDNTIPQNTEGDEVLSVTITPTNASSMLRIDVTLLLSTAAANGIISGAIFVDSTAGAIYAGSFSVGTTGRMETLRLLHHLSAGSTSARTYKVRAGAAAATDAMLNGDDSSRIFGGVAISSIEVMEILPQ